MLASFCSRRPEHTASPSYRSEPGSSQAVGSHCLHCCRRHDVLSMRRLCNTLQVHQTQITQTQGAATAQVLTAAAAAPRGQAAWSQWPTMATLRHLAAAAPATTTVRFPLLARSSAVRLAGCLSMTHVALRVMSNTWHTYSGQPSMETCLWKVNSFVDDAGAIVACRQQQQQSAEPSQWSTPRPAGHNCVTSCGQKPSF